MKARIRGVQSYTGEFKFLFGCHLGKIILVQTDNLFRTLRDARCTTAEGQYVATVKVSGKMRNDESFGLELKLTEKTFNIGEPMLCRQRKRPAHFSFGTVGTETILHNRQKTCTGQFILMHWTTPFKLLSSNSNKETGLYSKIYRNCFYIPYKESNFRNPWVKSISCI